MKRPRKVPDFKNDREAADFWATHDSARYAGELEEEKVAVDSRLRRRVRARAAVKRAVTLRLENQQISGAKEIARRKSIPYQTLMRMWIAEGLTRERSRSV